jgi:hypothetical protein
MLIPTAEDLPAADGTAGSAGPASEMSAPTVRRAATDVEVVDLGRAQRHESYRGSSLLSYVISFMHLPTTACENANSQSDERARRPGYRCAPPGYAMAMSTAWWFTLAGGVIGAAVAIHGMVTLASSRSRTATSDLPQRRRSALYSLYFGVSLVLMLVASMLNAFGWTVPAMLTLGASMAALAGAIFRYRPGSKASPKAR